MKRMKNYSFSLKSSDNRAIPSRIRSQEAFEKLSRKEDSPPPLGKKSRPGT